MKRKTKLLRLVMLCMLMLFSASEMWATTFTVDVKCEPTGVAKVYAKYETDEDYAENQNSAFSPQNSGDFNLKYDNLQQGYTFLGWSKGAPSTNASDMVSTDQEATVTVLSSDPTVTYYANFASGSKFTVTEDASISEHGTVTYKVNGTETAPVSGVINAKENDEITLIVTPNTGWIVDVDNVKAESYTTWDAAGARRRSAPDNIQILGDVTLTKSTTAENTWTFTMPAASVLVSAAYIPVAAFAPAEPSGTLAPTAAEGVIAGEDKAIIVAGTVANIPEITNPQGTVKYFATDNKDMTAEQAAAANGWVETLPTAAGYTGDYAENFKVYVWYYIQAAEGYADSEPQCIEVTVGRNLFNLTLKPAPVDKVDVTIDAAAATPTQYGKIEGVKMGKEVELKAKTGYKFRKVEAKKTLDFTDRVSTTEWEGKHRMTSTYFVPAVTTSDGRQTTFAETYYDGADKTGVLMQQTVNVANGTYTVELYANSYAARVSTDLEEGATDAAYVFANDVKQFIVSKIGTSFTESGVYTIEVTVTDGQLTLGIGKEKANTNWHTIQIKSLTLKENSEVE